MRIQLCFILLFITFGLFNGNAQTVYINNFTQKYHIADCPKINKKYFAVDLKEALDGDYVACNVCNPPLRVVSANIDSSLNNEVEIKYTRVIKTDSVGKANLFVALNDWFATNFKSANDVIQMADKDAGVIIGKGTFSYYYENDDTFVRAYNSFTGYIDFTIKIYIKDNRYKVEIFNFSHKAINNSGYPLSLGYINNKVSIAPLKMHQKYYNAVWADIIPKIKLYSENLFTSLEQTTKKVKAKDGDDGW